MATACGPEMATQTTRLQSLDNAPSSRRLPIPITIDKRAESDVTFESPQSSPSNQLPLPNPPFVFPARPSSSSAPSSFSRATGRRSRPMTDSDDQISGSEDDARKPRSERPSRSPALPAFSFNPGASLSPETAALLSPPLSPQSPRPIPSPSRPGGHGHRRGGSEFVGGNIRSGEAITVMSTSPTKSESGFASPTFQPPPPGRRGHAHRRSAAISSHDLSLILQPTNANAGPRGSSAPASPAEFSGREPSVFIPPEKTVKPVESEPILRMPESPTTHTPPASSPRAKPPSPAKAVPRARVGFSDTLEFIPRPLSIVSTDTSSTVTARPGHSVSGSISSIVSATPSSAVERDNASTGATPSVKPDEYRPSTAGPVLERTQSSESPEPMEPSLNRPRRRSSVPVLIHVPRTAAVDPPEPSPSKTPKRWSFFGLDPFLAAASPTRSRPHSSSSADSASKPNSALASSSDPESDSAADPPDANALSEKRTGKKPAKKKKVKTWAGSILTRKGKPRGKKPKQTHHKSEVVSEPADADSEEETVETDAIEPPVECTTPTVTVTEALPAEAPSWGASPKSPTEESSYPMIDLDAALGPFNTPLPNNPEWEAAQKASGQSKRQLHSAQGMKGFSGPGMHYHRRAESAPEMVPFEAHRFGIHRFGSSSTMADVFEEEEEDDGAEGTKTPATEASSSAVKPEDHDGEYSSNGSATPPASTLLASGPIPSLMEPPTEPSVKRMPSGLNGTESDHAATSIRSERSMTSLRETLAAADHVQAPEFRTSSIFQDTPGSSASATPSPRRILSGRDLPPVEISPLHLPAQSYAPISPYSMSHTSSFPSPRSPMSYDAQRISTAPSSVNDENTFQSLLLGEPGPEVRISVDDIPSLTSSNSTMTRESSFAPNAQMVPTPFRSDHPRPASVSSGAFGRRRSSLASLSRLISSSHGERSKLSMEVTLDNEADKKAKVSKTKRLSRMMQFWRPKDATD